MSRSCATSRIRATASSYPLLISPVYALFESLPDAYAALKVLNAVLMSLAAVPAYLLARRVVRDGLALLAALLAVALPSLAYTGTVMTENVFYPLFLVVTLVLVLVLERPTTTRVVLLFALLGLAFATRVQAVALLPAILIAPFVLSIFERRGLGSTISRVPLAVRSHRGSRRSCRWRSNSSAGARLRTSSAPTRRSTRRATTSVRFSSYLWWHVAELSLYVLVIPLAATIVLLGRARSLDRRLQAFPRGDGLVDGLPRSRRGRVRLAILRPNRGAEPLLRGASLLPSHCSPGSSAGHRALECLQRPQRSSPRYSSSPSPSIAS